MEVTATDIINSLYHPTDILHLRVFDDKKRGIFTGQKLSVEAGKFVTIEKMLRDHNEQGHGIFLVVNSGGQLDKEINRINAQFVESDSLSFEEMQARIDGFPMPPSMIIKTRKSLHTYWFVKDAEVARFRPIQKALPFGRPRPTSILASSIFAGLPRRIRKGSPSTTAAAT